MIIILFSMIYVNTMGREARLSRRAPLCGGYAG